MKRLLYLIAVLFLPVLPAHAADLNGYTAKYECRAGGPNCNVDVATLVAQACQQTITTATTPTSDWSAINWSNNVICIQGGDHTGRGTLTLGSSGISGTRKVLRYYRSGDTNDEPWNQTAGNRATVKHIYMNGASYWIISRITINGTGGSYYGLLDFQGGATNNIADRVLGEHGAASGVYAGGGNDSNTIQNSVFRNCGYGYGSDYNGININASPSDTHFVNNEVYGCNKGVYISEHLAAGTVIENNDIWVPTSMYTDCNGNYNGTGPCAATKTQLGTKNGGTSSNPVKIIHNRVWGNRATDSNVCCVDIGEGVLAYIGGQTAGTDPNTVGAKYTLFQNNILMDGQHGIGGYWDGVRNNSFIGNIIYKIHAYKSSYQSYATNVGADKLSEWYLNTIIDADHWTGLAGDYGGTDSDVRCNVMISDGSATGTAGSGTQVDYNAYYGTTDSGETNKISKPLVTRANSTAYSLNQVIRTTATPPANGTAGDFLYLVITAGTSAGSPPTYTTTLGGTTTDGTMVVKAIRGPYTFYRKLRTSPESSVIPYARLHTSAPEHSLCPSGYASRASIGVDDTQP